MKKVFLAVTIVLMAIMSSANAMDSLTAVMGVNVNDPVSGVTISADQEGYIGIDNAAFTVAATAGELPLLYQWQVSLDGGATWSDLGGETNATLNITPIVANGLYRCVVSNVVNSVTSPVGTLTAYTPLTSTLTLSVDGGAPTLAPSTVSVNPTGAMFNENVTLLFTAIPAGGWGAISYEWQISLDGGATWNPTGDVGSTMTITPITEPAQAQYRCRVYDSGT